MKNIQSNYIEKVVEIMKGNEITEVTMDDGKTSLYIKSATFEPVIKEKRTSINISETETAQQQMVEEQQIVEEKKNEVVPITSKMIGLFYSKPTPAEEPFVKVGDTVKAGQVICIEDGKPVEYGQVIMYVEKN